MEAPIDLKANDVCRTEKKPKNQEEWPGKIKVADRVGMFSGCKAVVFKSVEEWNAFAENNLNHLVVSWQAVRFMGGMEIVALYTKTIPDEELRRMMRVQAKVDELIREEDEKTAEAEEKAKEEGLRMQREEKAKEERELAELKRLAHLGRQCMKHHQKKESKKELDEDAKEMVLAAEDATRRMKKGEK